MAKPSDNDTSPARRRMMATPIWVRRLKFWFSRENLREFATTLGLVVPLTVLIWIWAEREQTLDSDVQLTVDVRSRNPGTVVSLARADDRTGPAAISVKISGPKVGIDSLKAAIATDPTRSQIAVEVPDDVGTDGTRDVAVQPLLDQQNLFRDYGITVRATEPDTLKVRADPVVTEELRVVLPNELALRVDSVVTDPPTVRVRGSAAAIERLRREKKLVAELDILNRSEVRAKQPGSSATVEKAVIKPIGVPGITIEPTTIAKATLTFSSTSESVLQGVVVNYSIPAGLPAQVRLSDGTLTSVRLSGPEEVLRQLQLLEGDARPYAVIRVTREDMLGRKPVEKKPTFANLPEGVRVVDSAPALITVTVTELPGGVR